MAVTDCMAQRAPEIKTPAWPDIEFETNFWHAGKINVAGIDEAGRGAWAGPVTAAAVILPAGDSQLSVKLKGVRDSKLMSPVQRRKWAEVIRQVAVAAASGWADTEEIENLGILPATRLAMRRAVENLFHPVDQLLIDAVSLPDLDCEQTSLIKGDARSLSIAAASVIAKTERDHYMELLEEKIPGYGFDRHKGYGTAHHQARLAKLGVSTAHRRSYAPIRALLNKS